MKDTTRTLIILHTAVFLAGWTGIFGRLIALSGIPLVWYRILVSVVTLALVMAVGGRLHKVARPALLRGTRSQVRGLPARTGTVRKEYLAFRGVSWRFLWM